VLRRLNRRRGEDFFAPFAAKAVIIAPEPFTPPDWYPS
jgi:hypothetical protein